MLHALRSVLRSAVSLGGWYIFFPIFSFIFFYITVRVRRLGLGGKGLVEIRVGFILFISSSKKIY